MSNANGVAQSNDVPAKSRLPTLKPLDERTKDITMERDMHHEVAERCIMQMVVLPVSLVTALIMAAGPTKEIEPIKKIGRQASYCLACKRKHS